MTCFPYKRKGSQVWRGKYSLQDSPRIYDVPLRVQTREQAEVAIRKIRREKQDELLGLGPTKFQVSAQLAIAPLLSEYVADLRAQQLSKKHVALAQNRTARLCEECSWKRLGEISAAGFTQWRSQKGQTLSPKTTNHYLNLVSVFLDWLVDNKRLPANPLKSVKKAETAGHERRIRRALSDAEIELLIRSSPKWAMAYFFAAYTGIRRGEMKALHWADLVLDATPPRIVLRASTTKNSKRDAIVLHADVAAELRLFREREGVTTGKVFRRGLPKPATLRKDLKACGIEPVDELGQLLDFHALRHTACTTMLRYGVGQRSAQHQMRHSDPRLTAKVYMDEALLPVAAELEKVKVIRPSSLSSHTGSQKVGKTSPETSKADQTPESEEDAEDPDFQRESPELSNSGKPWPEVKSGGEGGIRTHGALRHSAFRVRCDRPLCHLSGAGRAKRTARF